MSLGIVPAIAWFAALSQPAPTEEVAAPTVEEEPAPSADVPSDAENAGSETDTRDPAAERAAVPSSVARPSVDSAALRASFRAHIPGEVASTLNRRRGFCAGSTDPVSEEHQGLVSQERRFAQQRNNDAAGANILDDAGTSTGAERLALAVDTGIDGVEAGVALSPLALVPSFSPKTPHGPSLLLAALKDGKVRAGAGYSVTVKQPVDAASVWVANACDNPDKQAASVAKGVEKTLSVSVENAYVAVCDAVVPGLPEFEASACAGSTACDTAKTRASQITRSCSAKVSVRTLAANTRKLADHEKVTPELRGAIRGLEAQLGTLESAGVSLVALANGPDAASFLKSYRAQQWSAVSVRVGLDGSVDFARRQFGTRRLELDEPGEPGQPEQLDDGSVLAWRAGPTALRKAGRLQTSVGVSGGQGAPVGSKDMFTFLQPSASLSWLVGFLDDEKVDRDVRYRERIPEFDKDGALPAHVVLGARASMTVPITSPDFQSDPLNAATFLVHADFVVTKKLKFRLGVPVSAELVEQEANTDAEPDIPKRTVLRWTVPVFATTVLAF